MTRIPNGPLRAALALAIWAVCLLTASCAPAPNPDALQAGTPEEQMAAFTELGKARLLQGDLAGALSELSKAEAINPKNIDTLTLLGLTYYTRKDYDKAIGYFTRSLALDPSKSDVHNNLGLVYMDMRDYEKAQREFELCLNDPTYARSYLALYNLGVLAEQQGRESDAEGIYQNVMMINPQYSPPFLRLATMRYGKEDYRAASDYLLNAVRLDPNSVDAYWLLAETYEKLGNRDEAAEAYGKVIILAPNTSRAMEAQSRVRRVLGYE
ncbi:MAG: tetratricopeptide repeat protein [Deltaproteobacteria bacterium]|jgi:type IV pilus biogenesis/stability protein PilW|nr:tetratricopeptide repeat protein [Deltaproteobacteria bacterium]